MTNRAKYIFIFFLLILFTFGKSSAQNRTATATVQATVLPAQNVEIQFVEDNLAKFVVCNDGSFQLNITSQNFETVSYTLTKSPTVFISARKNEISSVRLENLSL